VANLANLTPFAARDFPSILPDGREALVIVVGGRFDLPGKGTSRPNQLTVAEEQPPLVAGDVYWGEPGQSSIRYEVQNAFARPSTDIYLNGHARPPGGKPVAEMVVRLTVGSCRKEIAVIGDRVWKRGVLGMTASAPQPFESMPLVYERAFGGYLEETTLRKGAWEARNPVGRGLYRDAAEAQEQPLPNLEDPANRIRSWSDRPQPMGTGPVARAWQPRVRFGGTYDQKWVDERAPFWPLDMDLRFFQAASAGLISPTPLVGGESVVLEGVSAKGPIHFELPRRRFQVKSQFQQQVERKPMKLDGVLIEPDAGAVTLFWRATVPVHRAMPSLRFNVVRELEAWEGDPK
jgi:hypothetical protein